MKDGALREISYPIMNKQRAVELLSSDDWREQFKGYYNLLKLSRHILTEELNKEHSKEFIDILESELTALSAYLTAFDRRIDYFSKGIYGKEYYALTCREYMDSDE